MGSVIIAQVLLLSKHRASVISSLENADCGTGTIVRMQELMATSQISLLIRARSSLFLSLINLPIGGF